MAKDSTATGILSCDFDIYVADVDTAAPAADAAPGVGWTNIGYVSNESVAQAFETEEVTLNAGNSCDPLAKGLKSRTISYEIAPRQLTKAVFELVYGAGTWAASGGGEKWTPDALASTEKAVLVVLPISGTTQEIRFHHPRCAVAATAANFATTDDGIDFPLVATVLKPETGNATEIFAAEALATA